MYSARWGKTGEFFWGGEGRISHIATFILMFSFSFTNLINFQKYSIGFMTYFNQAGKMMTSLNCDKLCTCNVIPKATNKKAIQRNTKKTL